MEYRAKSIGTAAFLLCVSFASHALTLGNLRGSVLIGRPLNVTVPVQVEQTEDAGAACFEAEVFHADVRQPVTGVGVSVEPTGEASSLQLRIRSSTPVNEPVVSVTLRTRCGLKAERRYTLLADLPTAADLTASPPLGVVSVTTPSAAGSPPVAANSAPLSMTAESALVKPRQAVRAKLPAATNEALKSAAKPNARTPKKGSAPSAQSRLQLDNSELFSDRIALLDQEQPDAALDFVSPDQQKVQDLQGTIKSLQTSATQNDAALQELQVRLQQSETERFPAWLVLVLAGFLLAAMAAIALLWVRQRRMQAQDGAWWKESVMPPDTTAVPLDQEVSSVSLAPAPLIKPKIEPRLNPVRAFQPSSQWPDSKNYGVDVNVVEMGESRFHQYLQSGEVQSTPNANANTDAEPPHATLQKSETQNAALISELRQQAEFFVALGQTDQAAIVLEKLIHDSPVPNPHVFLDLLGLLHSLRKKTEFQRYREDFNRLFHVITPEFVRFKSEGRSLEDYPATLADVIAHWAGPEALECINAHVVRPPHQSPGGALDLAAFRDLLLLQAIALQLRAQESDPEGGANRLTSLTAPPAAEPGGAGLSHMMVLDLDFSDEGPLVDSGRDDGLRAASQVPVTIPAELKSPHPTPLLKDNSIDFDLSEDVQFQGPDRKP